MLDAILIALLFALLTSMSVQLVRIERLLRVIAVKASGDSITEVVETIKRTQH